MKGGLTAPCSERVNDKVPPQLVNARVADGGR
jgi:hypothetical protein